MENTTTIHEYIYYSCVKQYSFIIYTSASAEKLVGWLFLVKHGKCRQVHLQTHTYRHSILLLLHEHF